MSILVKGVGKNIGVPPVRILSDVSLEIQTGEFIALTGRSGSGKSTLLYILSSLDSPTEGQVIISGQSISKLKSDDLYRFRNQNVGFVFQFHYLLAELSALENVLMPAMKFRQETRRRPFNVSS